jgi:hypothetical protein
MRQACRPPERCRCLRFRPSFDPSGGLSDAAGNLGCHRPVSRHLDRPAKVGVTKLVVLRPSHVHPAFTLQAGDDLPGVVSRAAIPIPPRREL